MAEGKGGLMATPGKAKQQKPAQDDPGVSNEPEGNSGNFDLHIYTQLSQVFERLGVMSERLGTLTESHKELKASVDKHEKVVSRCLWTFAVLSVLFSISWFIWSNYLSDHVEWKTTPAQTVQPAPVTSPSN